jgi:hypothetical protein
MRRLARLFTPAVALLAPAVASAHAFGQQYTLSLPISLYILGGTAAFIASASIILLFSDPVAAPVRAARLRPYAHPRRVGTLFKVVGLAALLLELALCFFGGTDYFSNPAIVLLWIYLLLGFTYLSVFVGGLWELMNPFKTIAQFFVPWEDVAPYPKWLSYWPALLLFFGLISLELYSGGRASDPLTLGLCLIIYISLMLIGSGIFGAREWIRHAEMTGVFFGLVSLFAPVRLTPRGAEVSAPGSTLVRERPETPVLVLFILFMLSSTAFDGVHETKAWYAVLNGLHNLGLPFLPGIIGTIGLALSPFFFFAFFALAIWLMRALSGGAKSIAVYLRIFGYSLIPIAIAYHFAHYFNLLLGEGQRLFYQISDPFSLGWNLFGTAHYSPNFVPLGADTVWYIQLAVIVAGHIVAAFVAHRIAVREFPRAAIIVRSQLPMLLLMVGYTALGLWILSRPFAV